MVLEVIVERDVGCEAADAAPGREDEWRVEDGRDHVEFPALDRGGVGEDLEGRARLTGCVRHVDPAARSVVVVAPDHGENFAVARVFADQRRVVEVVEVAFLRDLVAHDLFRDALQVEVERRVDPVAATVTGMDVVLLGQGLQDVPAGRGRPRLPPADVAQHGRPPPGRSPQARTPGTTSDGDIRTAPSSPSPPVSPTSAQQ